VDEELTNDNSHRRINKRIAMESSKRRRLESANDELSVHETSIDESSIDESSTDDQLLKLQTNDSTEFECYSEDEIIYVLDILQNQPNHSSLKELYIYCTISIDNARLIANILKINKSITTLHVGEGYIVTFVVMALWQLLTLYRITTIQL
jgi:hypothetical protein